MRKSETIDFNGLRYYRYPDSPRTSLRAYYQRPGGSLHRAIWEHANGPVSAGHEIHHRDGNTLNNELENLECVDLSNHRRESQSRRPAREYKCAHCGTQFQSRSGTAGERRFCNRRCKNRRRDAEGLDVGEIVCVFCGKTHVTKNFRTVRYCSRTCYMRERHGHKPA